MRFWNWLLIWSGLGGILPCALQGQEAHGFAIERFHIGGGGGASSDGIFTVSGIVGQLDVGSGTSADGYGLMGGYGKTFAPTPDFLLGEPIIPRGLVDVDLSVEPVVEPSSRAFYAASVRRLIASEPGPVTVTWDTKIGKVRKDYWIGGQPFRTPVALYHTHVSTSNLTNYPPKETRAPYVTLRNVIHRFHWNQDIPEVSVVNGVTNRFIVLNPVTSELLAAQKTGLIVLEFLSSTGQHLGLEIVELRSPEQLSGPVLGSEIGSVLSPSLSVALPGLPHVSLGDDAERPRSGGVNGFVYQHQAASGKGDVYAIKKTMTGSEIEVFWQMKGELGIEWPYELDRYTADWPTDATKIQRYVRGSGDVKGPTVALPNALNAQLMPYQVPSNHAQQPDREHFSTVGEGLSLLKFAPGDSVSFQVIRSVSHRDAVLFDLGPRPVSIGEEIVELTHRGPAPGYVHRPEGDRYDYELYDDDSGGKSGDWKPEWTTRQIIPVNEGVLEVWWSNVNPNGEVQWPSLVKRYQARWPSSPEAIVIANQRGTGPIDPARHPNFRLYFQNDAGRPGFNPNDEHAFRFTAFGGQDGAGDAIFALRDDLGTPTTSQPFVLMKFHDPGSLEGPGSLRRWRYRVFQVLAEGIASDGLAYSFDYKGTAGRLIQPPYPISYLAFLEKCDETRGASGPFWRDRRGDFWAMAGGNDGGLAKIVMRYFYSTATGVIPGIYFPPGSAPAAGTHVPWLDRRLGGRPGQPSDIVYTIDWPDAPELRVGESLVKPKDGLPAIAGQSSVEIVYEQSRTNQGAPSVQLIDPTRIVSVGSVASIPGDVATVQSGGLTYFAKLPPHLRSRFWYSDTSKTLHYKGLFVEPPAGEAYLLLNALSQRDHQELLSLSSDEVFRGKIHEMAGKAASVIDVSPNTPFDSLALTAGSGAGLGYVTVAFGNSTNLTPVNEPISLAVIKVTCPRYRGEIKVIESGSPFDEKLTLRHSGDFAGRAEDFVFEWRTLPPGDDGKPPTTKPPVEWGGYAMVPSTGVGAVDITIGGPGLYTLTDNYFICRYRPVKQPPLLCVSETNQFGWSPWTEPQLAPGWIKRVVGRINPFNQRAEGGGLSGAESRFAAFSKPVNSLVSMISQAGPRAEGTVPLNVEAADKLGLIEIYGSVLRRGMDLSIEGNPPMDYGPANDALLLAAGRLSDLYMLLGNEAFADASDPTIAYGTDSGAYGTEASSIHSFQNQTASLLQEELALLRGRDDSLQPGVQNGPFYNRLVWNFTKGDGEVAYVNNYGMLDENKNGVIDDEDARIDYPQGHGDAWGHYLTAIKGYYTLLRSPYFTWVPRTEPVLVGGVAIQVDYLDERRFAKAAVARAQTGAEILNLTYRSLYSEEPSEQWQGYPDTGANGPGGWRSGVRALGRRPFSTG